MSKRLILTALAATGMMTGAVANANQDESGEADAKTAAASDEKTVMVDGQSVVVCTKTVQDSCINPREAGLDWGNRPLDHWPGKPGSEK